MSPILAAFARIVIDFVFADVVDDAESLVENRAVAQLPISVERRQGIDSSRDSTTNYPNFPAAQRKSNLSKSETL